MVVMWCFWYINLSTWFLNRKIFVRIFFFTNFSYISNGKCGSSSWFKKDWNDLHPNPFESFVHWIRWRWSQWWDLWFVLQRSSICSILNVYQPFYFFLGITIDKELLKPWFKHIQHELPHLIVPVGEHQTTTEIYETRRSSVHYRLEYIFDE
jgi:hypothetical protein